MDDAILLLIPLFLLVYYQEIRQLDLYSSTSTPTSSLSHVYLLVVVPEGYNASSVNLSDPTIDLYNPTSAVICSSFDSPEYPITLRFPGSRMLRVGDKINLLVAGFNDSSDFTIRTTVEFLYQV